jgi:hypothetical protein
MFLPTRIPQQNVFVVARLYPEPRHNESGVQYA